jgi:hypothetical protein
MTIVNQVMKRLVVEELRTIVDQPLSIDSRLVLERALPHLYVQGSPTGTITLSILKDATTVSVATLDLGPAMALAGKSLANYHGYVSFIFARPPILAAGQYTLRLEADSYSYDEDTFVGWVKLPSAESQTSLVTLPHDMKFVEIKAP